MDPCIWYKEEMVLLFNVDDCLMFSPYKDKIDELYASIKEDFNIVPGSRWDALPPGTFIMIVYLF